MMRAFYAKAQLSLTLRAPFLIAGLTPSRFGVDIAQIRNHRGFPIIPDSHVKGVLRHAWTARGRSVAGKDANEVFGAPDDGLEDKSGCLWFTDLVAEAWSEPTTIARVGIDEKTGSAKKGALFVIEQVARPGAEVTFEGEATVRAKDATEAQAILDNIKPALRLVSSIGKFKTSGFGRIVRASLGPAVALPSGASDSFPKDDYQYRFGVNKPLLVDSKRSDANSFSAAQEVSGGTLKGALAAKLEADGFDIGKGDLNSLLSKLQFSHAFADIPHLRPFPLDYVQIGESKVPQVCPPPEELDFSNEKAIPSFAPDFKDADGQAGLRREYRTHVAIDAQTGSAKPGALFSTSSVLAEQSDGSAVQWVAEVSVPSDIGSGERKAFELCLNALEDGLFTLGKTKARTVDPKLTPAKAKPVPPAGDWRVVLDSQTLMLRECHLVNEIVYWKAFMKYWFKATGGAYKLLRIEGCPEIHARQSFASGYQQLRFPWFGPNRVEPFVLTEPGSVFVLTCRDKTLGLQKRATLERDGLPVAKWGFDERKHTRGTHTGDLTLESMPDHTLCPYGPQHGFGRIRQEGIR